MNAFHYTVKEQCLRRGEGDLYVGAQDEVINGDEVILKAPGSGRLHMGFYDVIYPTYLISSTLTMNT